jgi:hypothetical protein
MMQSYHGHGFYNLQNTDYYARLRSKGPRLRCNGVYLASVPDAQQNLALKHDLMLTSGQSFVRRRETPILGGSNFRD